MEINVKEIRDDKAKRIKSEIENHGKMLMASIIMVGNNDASNVYVRNKKRTLIELGIDVNVETLGEDATYEDILMAIQECERISDGVLLQLPLPKKFSKEEENDLVNSIDSLKDIDCLNDSNLGEILGGSNDFLPCTVQACIDIMKSVSKDNLTGKRALVIGRSKLVGLPLNVALINEDMTVTTIHSKSDLGMDICSFMYEGGYDYVISATGLHGIVDGQDLNDNITFIDVGINRDENGKLCGDLKNPEFASDMSKYTPVPRGVGIMTVVNVAENLLKLSRKQLT